MLLKILKIIKTKINYNISNKIITSNFGDFKNIKNKCFTLTHNDEFRYVAECDIGEKLKIKNTSLGIYELGIFSENNFKEGSIVIKNSVYPKKILSIEGYKWNECLVKNNSKKNLVIENKSNVKIYISHPIKKSDNKYNKIILLLIDSLSKDKLSKYTKKNKKSVFNKILKNSIWLEKFYSISEWTLPIIISLFYGLKPNKHSTTQEYDAKNINYDKKTSILKFFKDNNYTTFGYGPLTKYNLSYGTSNYFDKFDYGGGFTNIHRAKSTINDFLKIKSNSFLYCHIYDTYFPLYSLNRHDLENFKFENLHFNNNIEYNNFISKKRDSNLEIEISKKNKKILNKKFEIRLKEIDQNLSKILNKIDNKTTLIISADHGNYFDNSKKTILGESGLNIPLIIYNKKFKQKIIKKKYFNTLDLRKILIKLTTFNNKNKIINFLKKLEKDEIISESIWKDKYKVSYRNSNFTYHYTCEYDEKNKKIKFNNKINDFLFRSNFKNEDIELDKNKNKNLINEFKKKIRDFIN